MDEEDYAEGRRIQALEFVLGAEEVLLPVVAKAVVAAAAIIEDYLAHGKTSQDEAEGDR